MGWSDIKILIPPKWDVPGWNGFVRVFEVYGHTLAFESGLSLSTKVGKAKC
jgi:hypothetical protein